MSRPAVIVATRLWPPRLDAVGTYSARLAGALAELGHPVACATDAEAVTGALEHIPHMNWDRAGGEALGREAARRGAVVLFQYVPHLYQGRGLSFRAADFIRACRASGARVVTVVHETFIDAWWPPQRLFVDLVQRRLLSRVVHASHAVVAPCELNRRRVMAAGAPAPRVLRVPVGASIGAPKDLAAAKARGRERWAGKNERLVALLGLARRSRGLEGALDAFAALTATPCGEIPLSARLMIIGPVAARNGVYFAKLCARTRRLGIENRVTWTGYLPDEEVSGLLAAADAYWYAGGGGLTARSSAAASAFTHGAPVIAVRPPVLDGEFRDGENLIWVAPRASRALAEATRRLWSDAALETRLRRGALALAQGALAWDHIARSVSDLVARVAEEERDAT